MINSSDSYNSYSISGYFDSYDNQNINNDAIHDNCNSSARNDVALWRAVITQALMDAGSNSQKREMKKAKSEAIAWLAGLEEDFEMVCSYANMSPDYVRKKAKEAIARGCTWREVNLNSFMKNRKKKLRKNIKKHHCNEEPPLQKVNYSEVSQTT